MFVHWTVTVIVTFSGRFRVVPACGLPGMPAYSAWITTGPLLLTFKTPVPKLVIGNELNVDQSVHVHCLRGTCFFAFV